MNNANTREELEQFRKETVNKKIFEITFDNSSREDNLENIITEYVEENNLEATKLVDIQEQKYEIVSVLEDGTEDKTVGTSTINTVSVIIRVDDEEVERDKFKAYYLSKQTA